MDQEKELIKKKFYYSFLNGVFHKYSSVMSAYLMLGYSVFGSKKEQYLRNVFNDPSLIMADFVKNSILLLNFRKVNKFLILKIEPNFT